MEEETKKKKQMSERLRVREWRTKKKEMGRNSEAQLKKKKIIIY